MKRILQSLVMRGARACADNVEKFALAAATAFLAAAMLDFITRDRIGFSPEDMIAAARDARARMASGRPNPPAVFPYHDAVADSRYMPSPAAYALSTLLDPPLWPHRKRGSPEVLPPQELLASASHGVFAMAPPDGAVKYTRSGLRGQRWVVLTAAIPYAAQREAFQEVFGTAWLRIPATDRPHYAYMRVERADVEPGTARYRRNWQRLNVREMLDRQAYWHGQAEEVVDQRCLPAPANGLSLAFPLGPRKDAAWGAEVSHPRIAAESRAETPPPATVATAGEASWHGRSSPGREGLQLAANRVSAPESDRAGVSGSDFLLLRFFDYTVEPGRRYCYRVRLLLANPNFGVSAHQLDNEGMRTVRFLESPWSEASQVVAVPADDQVLLVGVGPRGKQAHLMLTHFAADDGEIAFKEIAATRGQLLDFSTDSIGRVELARSTPASRLSDGQPSAESTRSVEWPDFTTGLLLLDMQGGRRLLGKGRTREPARILLVDARGNLIVRDELDDAIPSRRVKELAAPIGDDRAIAAKAPAHAESRN